MYISTRGGGAPMSAAAAIKTGIAADGGLMVPDFMPRLDPGFIDELVPLDYQSRAVRILRLFLDDYTASEIADCVRAAYNSTKFDNLAVAPLKVIQDDISVLELWHGPTSAFKDMALQMLPQLLSRALSKTGEKAEIVILVATSGDTGKAALEGFKDVPQTRIIVFYPEDGVSAIQRLQMVTQDGGNVAVVAVRGNFDDAQTGVKQIFNDRDFNSELDKRGFKLSSANSINWGRLLPQIVYYFSAYADMVKNAQVLPGQPVNFVVPTGNFGNILAGYYAKMMGLPVGRLICAANSNNVLADFLRTGVYDRNRKFYKTLSPSMDILISSNLERLLYHITGGDTAAVAGWMSELNSQGVYNIGAENLSRLQGIFWSGWADDVVTVKTVAEVYKEYRYVLDPHTAVAWRVAMDYRRETGDATPLVIVSTASPYKFADSVLTAVAGKAALIDKSDFEVLRELAGVTGWPVPPALSALERNDVRHRSVCDKGEMPNVVTSLLK